jgi:hypothetical protein
MHERLVEDWLSKAKERSFQTPFAQSLLAEGMQVLRVGHSPHEHGKDIIAIDRAGKVHAYQLKDGDCGLSEFEREPGQMTALVETPVEHPGVAGHQRHQPWLVISGKISIPLEDRIRAHNVSWKRRRYVPLRVITGAQLLERFSRMAANFWPQKPEDSRNLFTLFLADGKGTLDYDSFARLVTSVIAVEDKPAKSDVVRSLAAANLFASYALSPFYTAANYWEIVQGWTMTAAHIAWAAEEANLEETAWRPTFQLSLGAALAALDALALESLEEHALRPAMFSELDTLTRSRCTICAGVIAARILATRNAGTKWAQEDRGKELLQKQFQQGRFLLWGESAVPFFLAATWALDHLRGDAFADGLLMTVLGSLVDVCSPRSPVKPPPPHDSADEANAKHLRRLFEEEKALERQSAASYSLEPLVTLATRRLWKNALAARWLEITKIDLIRLRADRPRDLLLWDWGQTRGVEQTRIFGAPQSWSELLQESRKSASNHLPHVLREHFDFALLFLLCFPHRLTTAFAKHMDDAISQLPRP